jgi:acyl-CoA thioesterase-1
MRLLCLALLLPTAGCALRPAPQEAGSPQPIRILILGDSISIGYTPFVREMLAGQATVARPMAGNGERAENCAGTNYGQDHIARWLNLEGGGFDVVHFNFGLHDLKHVHPETGKNSNDPDHPHQAELESYSAQLRAIAEQLQTSGAGLIFATTTPVPAGGVQPYRDPEDVLRYNAAAIKIMGELGIGVNDLYSFALARLGEIQRPVNVHFTEAGSRALAGQVVAAVRVTARR